LRDVRGEVSIEYLVIVGGVALVLLAAAVVLRDGYAKAFVARSFVVLGVE
jgi:Flp pilus assembly pilin Flp